MEISDKNWNMNAICRVCLDTPPNLTSIFESGLWIILSECTKYKVEAMDGMPEKICSECSSKAHDSFNFKQLCEKSYETLRQQLVQKTYCIKNEASSDCEDSLANQEIAEEFAERFLNVNYSEDNPTDTSSNHDESNVVLNIKVENEEIIETIQHNATGAKRNHCHECNRSFSRSDSLKRHRLSMHMKKPLSAEELARRKIYKCELCPRSFSEPRILKGHMQVHTKIKPFPCDQCPKKFTRHKYLKAHMESHTGLRSYCCVHCPKKFSYKKHLEIHYRTHSGERPFKCKFCSKTFIKQYNLSLHERTHTGEKPFTCTQCSQGFANHSNLKTHMRKHEKFAIDL